MGRLDPIVYKYTAGAEKPFLPNGNAYSLFHFQRAFSQLGGKIRLSESLLQQYGLKPKVYLGRQLLFDIDHVATYLYDNAIHPRFFAEALHVIASHSTMLDRLVERIQLRNLRRDQIATTLNLGMIARTDLGENFEVFETKPIKERLEILEKLGVLVLKPGASLPTAPASAPPAPLNTTPITPPLLALMLQDPSKPRGKQ